MGRHSTAEQGAVATWPIRNTPFANIISGKPMRSGAGVLVYNHQLE
jgi:hypothetical protein